MNRDPNVPSPEFHRKWVGKALLIPPEAGKCNYWIGCLFTSDGYGKGKSKLLDVLSYTGTAIDDLAAQIEGVKASGRDIGECWAPMLNTGKFGVEWEKTRDVLEKGPLKVIVSNPPPPGEKKPRGAKKQQAQVENMGLGLRPGQGVHMGQSVHTGQIVHTGQSEYTGQGNPEIQPSKQVPEDVLVDDIVDPSAHNPPANEVIGEKRKLGDGNDEATKKPKQSKSQSRANKLVEGAQTDGATEPRKEKRKYVRVKPKKGQPGWEPPKPKEPKEPKPLAAPKRQKAPDPPKAVEKPKLPNKIRAALKERLAEEDVRKKKEPTVSMKYVGPKRKRGRPRKDENRQYLVVEEAPPDAPSSALAELAAAANAEASPDAEGLVDADAYTSMDTDVPVDAEALLAAEAPGGPEQPIDEEQVLDPQLTAQ